MASCTTVSDLKVRLDELGIVEVAIKVRHEELVRDGRLGHGEILILLARRIHDLDQRLILAKAKAKAKKGMAA